MYSATGVGLAAPQVGVSKRVVVIDTHDQEEGEAPSPLYLANPEIVWHSEEKICHEEDACRFPTNMPKWCVLNRCECVTAIIAATLAK